MKKTLVLGYLLSIAVASPALASAPALKYDLIENKTIKTDCVENNQPERSRVKIVEEDKVPGTNYRTVKFKAWLCTRKYGFREVKLWVNIPEILFQANEIEALRPGSSVSVSGIPSTNEAGRNLNLRVTKQRATNVLSVSVNPVQVAWPNRPEGNNEYQPLTVFVADPRDLRSVPGFREDFHQPWKKVIFQYTHSFAGTFVLEGNLEDAAVER